MLLFHTHTHTHTNSNTINTTTYIPTFYIQQERVPVHTIKKVPLKSTPYDKKG
nr:MAG TPA: hypothetical protein [Caudoviricetes sp.]